jgi:hypothetical protein
MNTFAGVKKANARRAIYVDRALENSCELHADMAEVCDYEEGLDLSLRVMELEIVIDELMQEWEQIQATFRNIQSIEINAETRAAMLSRLSLICPPMVPNILEVPRSLVAQHSPPNLSRHLSSNAPPSLKLSTDLVSASALAYRKGNAHRT